MIKKILKKWHKLVAILFLLGHGFPIVYAYYPEPSVNLKPSYLAVKMVQGYTHSAAWKNNHIVLQGLSFNVGKNADVRLHLRFKDKPRAGIARPNYVDLYCMQNGRIVAMKGFFVRAHLKNNLISIPLMGSCGANLFIVIQTSGRFLYIDDLSIRHSNGKLVSSKVLDLGEPLRKALTAAAVSSLKKRYEIVAQKKINKFLQTNSEKLLIVKPNSYVGVRSINDDFRIQIAHTVYASNGSARAEMIFSGVEGDNAFYKINYVRGAQVESLKFVRPILSRGGGYTYDFIEQNSHKVGDKFFARPLAMIQMALKDVVGDALTIGYSINGRNYEKTVGIKDLGLFDTDELMVGAWSYLHHWKNFTDDINNMQNKLLRDGVNIGVLHPRQIYTPFDDAEKKLITINALRDLGNSKKIILFLNWSERWKTLSKKKLKLWLIDFLNIVKVSGVDKNEVYLYPIDELNARRFKYFGNIYKLIKELEPNIKLYANPSAGSNKSRLNRVQLTEIIDYVDLWQPRHGEDFEIVKEVLFENGFDLGNLWVYQNLSYPAKINSPVCYQSLGISAALIGAAGIGTWSLTESYGTSSKDDFDGFRSDWSFIYEGESNFSYSRRYQGFIDGIRDYHLVKKGRESKSEIYNQYFADHQRDANNCEFL